MVEFKYVVYDDSDKHLGVDRVLVDKEFDNIGDAFDYAQDGLYTYIFREKFVDGELDEDEECVWSWDSTRDRDELISKSAAEEEAIRSEDCADGICEDIEIEVKADNTDELAKFAKAFLGDNFEFFDQDFDEVDEIPEVKVDVDPIEIPEDEESEETQAAEAEVGDVVDVDDIEDQPIVAEQPVILVKDEDEASSEDEKEESLEATVDQDLLDIRQPVFDTRVELEEPVDGNEIRAHEQRVKLDETRCGCTIDCDAPDLVADNAIKDCKVNNVVAHSADEKPVCDVERPLDKPLVGDPDITSEFYENLTDAEFAEELQKRINEKHSIDDFDTQIQSDEIAAVNYQKKLDANKPVDNEPADINPFDLFDDEPEDNHKCSYCNAQRIRNGGGDIKDPQDLREETDKEFAAKVEAELNQKFNLK